MINLSPEFDGFADGYQHLLRDPIRERFAPCSRFFAVRKWEVLKRFYGRTGRHLAGIAWLDVGCGFGELLSLGKSSVREAAGCDPSAEMLERCRGLNVRLQRSPVCLPYPNETFQLVTVVCVYHHVSSDMRPLLTAEARRVLTAGGLLCIIEHNPINPVTRLIVSRTPVDAQAQLLTAARVRSLMRSAKVKPIHTEYFLYLPERMFNVAQWFESLLACFPLGGQYATIGLKD
jgi:SAM-dependent methyltransferase